jgi:flagellin
VSDIQTAVNGAAGNPFQMTVATGTTYDPASDSGVLTAATTPGTAGVNPLNGSATGLTAGGLNADTAILTAATTPGTAGVDPQLGVGGITTGGTDALQGADTTLQGGQNAGGGLAANVTFQLTGSLGSQVFSFQTGTDIAQIVSAINADSDSTGVGAQAGTDSGTATPLLLNSTTFGSTGTVAVNVISEGAGGTFGSSLKNALGVAATQATGSDIQGTINGLAASGSGNTLSVDSPSLSMTMTVADGSSTQVNFNITGGGALFQLGPDVTSAEQARLGIESIDTSNLGGSAGLLYTLGSGGTAALAATGGTAAANQIVDQAVSQISDLRGRLGAFQSTTLQTNINALQNTVQDLTSAQSSIQDADFAAETANVTRAQILVQSGTSVLAIANKNPQNVLTLLQGL